MDDQSETIAFLSSAAAFATKEAPIRVDTHAAIVFLSGDRAWKLKRAVRFAYLDFSTVDRRHVTLLHELELNGRTTSGLYLAVRPITRADDDTLVIDGMGPPVDWLLEMRRIPADAMLDRIVDEGGLDDRLAKSIADRLLSFHAGLPPLEMADPVEAIRRIVDGNDLCMRQFADQIDTGIVDQVTSASVAHLEHWSPLLRRRAADGRVRHGHGDLHLGNIAIIDEVPTPFDCLEFDDRMATSDVLYDLAFLLMDLWQRGQHRQANLIINRYLDLSASDENGIALLPLFMSMRAAVRTHVEAAIPVKLAGFRSIRPQRYLAWSAAFLEEPKPYIVAIGGLSGTGKSTLARALSFALGRAPGARIIGSDVLRKRQHGLVPEDRLPASAYDAESALHVYDAMIATASATLRQGQSVILDATFATADDRRRLTRLSDHTGCSATAFWLRSDTAQRLDRVGARRDDPSDISPQVAKLQIEPEDSELSGWRILSADMDAAALAGLAQAALAEAGQAVSRSIALDPSGPA